MRDRLKRHIWLSQDSYIQKIYIQYNITLNNRKALKTLLLLNSFTIYKDTIIPYKIHNY